MFGVWSADYFTHNLNWPGTRGRLDFEGMPAVRAAGIMRLPPRRLMMTRVHFFCPAVLCTVLYKGMTFVKYARSHSAISNK